ncbi:hypothetical protein SNK04_013572 [Fusarium graminearum]
MRLVNTNNLQLEFFTDDVVPDYAILSHTWEQEEVLFHDIGQESANLKKGYAKLKNCCHVAKENGFDYIWDDTCCIDKASSAELSEAINSMYRYYQEANICYVYLADVSAVVQIPDSRWFTRGWTLQELIAPHEIIFFDQHWQELGTKTSLVSVLSERTSIPKSILCNTVELDTTSIAQRMSWAADRVTTRKEDSAYSLMGLFGINMPLLYGEGEKAFIDSRKKSCEFLMITVYLLGGSPVQEAVCLLRRLLHSSTQGTLYLGTHLHPTTALLQ